MWSDWGILAATLVLAVALYLPWLLVVGFVVRPADLSGVWVLVGVLVLILVAALVAGRWPYTHWLALVPVISGCLLLGVLVGIGLAIEAVRTALASLPLAEADNLVQTVNRLAALARLPTGDLDRLRDLTTRLASQPQIAFQPGYWWFGAGAIGLIVAGCLKLAASFAPVEPAGSAVDWAAGAGALPADEVE
jgi:hypothetical protein